MKLFFSMWLLVFRCITNKLLQQYLRKFVCACTSQMKVKLCVFDCNLVLAYVIAKVNDVLLRLDSFPCEAYCILFCIMLFSWLTNECNSVLTVN